MYRLVVKISDAYMAGGKRDEELKLRFSGGGLPSVPGCLALRHYVEGKKDYGLKAKELILAINDWTL